MASRCLEVEEIFYGLNLGLGTDGLGLEGPGLLLGLALTTALTVFLCHPQIQNPATTAKVKLTVCRGQ